MNTQKKTQDEKARKRLMEVARSGKSLMPRRAVGGPLMPSADEQERAKFFAPDPNMYRNDAKNMANVQDYIKEQEGQVPGQRPTAASVLDKFQTSQFAAQTPQDPMQQPLTLGGMQSLLGLGMETKKPSAQGYNPGMNLNGSMDKERISGFGQYVNPPNATLTGMADGGRMPVRATYDQLRLRRQDVDSAVDRMTGASPSSQEFAGPQYSAQARTRLAPQKSEGLLGGGMPGMVRQYAGGGRVSGWNVDRAAQLAAAENAAMAQAVSGVPQQATVPAQRGGMELSEGERMALEENRAREAAEVAAQKPAWKWMLGMARGGPLMPPVWDGREGGEVPPGPEGVDTVPAITQAGPVMLDSQIGEGRQEYVLTPEMVDALGGAGELDVLRQALGGQPMCGEGMACGGGRGVPKMAEGGGRDVTNPYLLRKAEEAQQAFIASHGPTYRGVGIEPFVQAEIGKLRNPPPPTAEQRRAAPAAQPPAMMPAVEVPLMPPAAPSAVPQKGSLPTGFSRTLLPDGTAQYSDEKGNFLEGPAQKAQGTFSTYSSKPVMEAAKAERDLAIAEKWYSLKPEERGRMPDYVAEALGKPYARPQTQDQVWAAAQRQQGAAMAQAEREQQAKIQEEIVKGEYGVKAAEAKAQDEASKYEVEYKQDPFSGEVVPSYKFKGRGPIPEGGLMPGAQSAAPAAKMPTLTPKQQHYWGQYQAEKNPAKKAAMRSALVEMFPELAEFVGAQGVR